MYFPAQDNGNWNLFYKIMIAGMASAYGAQALPDARAGHARQKPFKRRNEEKMENGIKGKVAFVTGAASKRGMGHAVAVRLALEVPMLPSSTALPHRKAR
jgi:hypothetical protein